MRILEGLYTDPDCAYNWTQNLSRSETELAADNAVANEPVSKATSISNLHQDALAVAEIRER